MSRSTAASTALGTLLLLLTAPWTAGNALSQQSDGEAVLDARCSSCHNRTADGGMQRITNLRKTPEGWNMTLARMQLWYGVQLNQQEQAVLVKFLADSRGLAPAESAPHRAVMERRPGLVEAERDPLLTEICARCHTYARFGLQRRGRDEWLKLSHTHLGQWPTIEYQALSRDRPWWQIATSEAPDRLAAAYPLETAAWRTWAARTPVDLSGRWIVAGQQPGRGSFTGNGTFRLRYADRYEVAYDLEYADGSRVYATGEAILYTGYEWRGSVRHGTDEVHEVYALSEDGSELRGRWFLADQDEIGADFRAVRATGRPQILALHPAYLRTGERTQVTLHGSGLGSTVELGEGVRIERVVQGTPEQVTLEVSVSAEAQVGRRQVRAGDAVADELLTVYTQLDRVQVEPPFTIARVGGNGGPLAPVMAQFEAVGYLDGPDGQGGTDDDLRVGVFPATWSTANNGEAAAAMDDARFAGRIDQAGLFRPGAAGPNPQRPLSANNVGDLAVIATVDDGGRKLEASGRLIVTVQRWNDPPLR